VSRNGVPVGELRPLKHRFVSRAVTAGAPSLDAERLRADLDVIVEQGIEPRACPERPALLDTSAVIDLDRISADSLPVEPNLHAHTGGSDGRSPRNR
jgi:hypothetical protein